MRKASSIILAVFLAAFLLPSGSAAGMFAPPEGPRTPAPITNSLPDARARAAAACGFSTTVNNLVGQLSYDSYVDWIEKLSGEEPVSIDGTQYTIETRYSYTMFAANNDNAKTFEYIYSVLQGWGYPAEQIEEDPYVYDSRTWKNLVLTIPGTQAGSQSVLLTAHLDDMPNSGLAPGADDNATGVAALLEAARVLKDHPLKHTVRVIWFTGEEQWLRGSAAYTRDHDLSGIIGVINLDMFGYDGDNDRCFDIHVGTQPASDFVGRCVQTSISAYDLKLSTGYNTKNTISASDHSSFWRNAVGAVEIGENFDFPYLDASCRGSIGDETEHYHKSTDTLVNMHPQYAYDITRAALAAFFSLGNMEEYDTYIPVLLKN